MNHIRDHWHDMHFTDEKLDHASPHLDDYYLKNIILTKNVW